MKTSTCMHTHRLSGNEKNIKTQGGRTAIEVSQRRKVLRNDYLWWSENDGSEVEMGKKKNFFKKDTHCKILVGSCGCKWDVAGRCSTAYRGLGKQVTLTSIHMLIILGGCSNFSALYALLKNFARPSERTTTHSVIHVGCLKRKKLIVDLSVQ